MKILVVDDDALGTELLMELLRLEGHEVQTAGNGALGMVALSTWQPDLILADLYMPHMDGRCLLQSIRQDQATVGIPVVVYTAASLDDISALPPDVPVLRKPVSPEELLRVIAAVHEKARST